jgi:hypothetical protein
MNRKDIKIVQVCSEPEKQREIDSYNSLSQLGYRYIRIINPRYTEYPPTHNVIDGHTDWIKMSKGFNEWGLTPGHYGAWQGHVSAILASFVDIDYTIVCECDCLLNVDPQYFKDRVDEAINLFENSNYKIVRFEIGNHQVEYTDKVSENLYLANIMTLGHCYMIHSKHRDFWLDRIDKIGFHTPDYWLNISLERVGELQPSFRFLKLTKQAEGLSIIDNVYHKERLT